MKRWVSLALTIVLFVATTTMAKAGPPLAPTKIEGPDLFRYDVTLTAIGNKVAKEAAVRFASKYGVHVTSEDLKVYDLSSEPGKHDLLIVPQGLEVVSVERSLQPDGHFNMRVITSTSAKHQNGSSAGDVSIASSSYNLVAGQCFARYYESGTYLTYGWIDHCYKLYKYSSSVWSGNSYKDLYALFHYGTARSTQYAALTRASLWSTKHPDSSTMEWSDWDPRSDTTRSCDPVTLGFSYGAASVSMNFTQCETWDITKYIAPGEFRNDWTGYAVQADREVAYAVQVYVPQGGWPRWYLTVDLDFRYFFYG